MYHNLAFYLQIPFSKVTVMCDDALPSHRLPQNPALHPLAALDRAWQGEAGRSLEGEEEGLFAGSLRAERSSDSPAAGASMHTRGKHLCPLASGRSGHAPFQAAPPTAEGSSQRECSCRDHRGLVIDEGHETNPSAASQAPGPHPPPQAPRAPPFPPVFALLKVLET